MLIGTPRCMLASRIPLYQQKAPATHFRVRISILSILPLCTSSPTLNSLQFTGFLIMLLFWLCLPFCLPQSPLHPLLSFSVSLPHNLPLSLSVSALLLPIQSAGHVQSPTFSPCSGLLQMPLAVPPFIWTIKTFPLTSPWSGQVLDLYTR